MPVGVENGSRTRCPGWIGTRLGWAGTQGEMAREAGTPVATSSALHELKAVHREA